MNIYQEEILDHYKNPRNWGEIQDADVVAEANNATCGDMVKFYLKFDGNKVCEVKFKCLGCSISTAASSMLSEKLVGMTKDQILSLEGNSVMEMLKIELSPSRLKCALLPLDALKRLK